MEQISSLLHFDVSKFKDIFNILHKLEEDGVVKEISDLFYKIFTSESKFTIGELIKIQKERSDKINVNKQYENNLSLFKSNFGLIVQLLLDNTFKVVVKENQSKLAKEKANSGEETETTNQTIEDAQTPRQRETPSSAKKNESPQQKSKKTINQTSEQKKPTKEKQSNSTAMLQGIISKDIGCQSSRSSKEYERENSLTQSQQLSSSSKKRSSNSIMSPLKIPVTSEFNHIQGSATFPQSDRKFLDVNLNGPGPAFYEVSRASPSNLKRSVSPTIGKAPRQTWIEVSAKTASPGPGGLYPSHHFISK